MRLTGIKIAILAACHTIGPALGLPDGAAIPTISYPTTITMIRSTTTSTTIYPNPAFAIAAPGTFITIMTVTTLEPWPSKPTVFPYTVTQTAKSAMTVSSLLSSSPQMTIVSTGTYTVQSTWILHQPAPTNLAAGTSADDLPCNECTPADWTPDQRCTRHNLDTACQGQCDLRDGLFWCYKRSYNEEVVYPDTPIHGRVCWGNNDTTGKMFEFAQLVEPCLAADHRIQCVPCEGLESNWGPRNWLTNP